jgi:hypothetical protein
MHRLCRSTGCRNVTVVSILLNCTSSSILLYYCSAIRRLVIHADSPFCIQICRIPEVRPCPGLDKNAYISIIQRTLQCKVKANYTWYRRQVNGMDKELKQIQRKIYLACFQDGLWDILLGCFILSLGISILTDITVFMGASFIAAYFLVIGLKRWLTYPRTGRVVIPQERKTSVWLLVAGVVVMLLILPVFFIVSISGPLDWLVRYLIFILGAIFAAIVCAIGYWWNVRRWYVYAALILAGVAAQQWLGLPVEYGFIIPGALVFLSGTAILIYFLRRYPRVTGEVNDESR